MREDILKEIKSLNSANATQEHDIPTKILKENADLFCCAKAGKFSSCLKQPDITPVLKNGSRNSKDN